MTRRREYKTRLARLVGPYMAAESLYLLVIIGFALQKNRGSNRTPDLTVLIRAFGRMPMSPIVGTMNEKYGKATVALLAPCSQSQAVPLGAAVCVSGFDRPSCLYPWHIQSGTDLGHLCGPLQGLRTNVKMSKPLRLRVFVSIPFSCTECGSIERPLSAMRPRCSVPVFWFPPSRVRQSN